MKIIKVQITKAEVNEEGQREMSKNSHEEWGGMLSREYLERMNIEPTRDNCYDFDESAVELDAEQHFNFWTSYFYFKLKDFKYLELDQQETGLVAILTLKDNTEYALTEASAHYLKGVIENL